MKATVAGSIFHSNGHDTGLHMDARLSGPDGVTCHFKLMGGHFVCDLDGLAEACSTADVLQTSRHLIDTVVLSQVVADRLGLHYTVEYCTIAGRGMVPTAPDVAPALPALAFDHLQEIFDIVGKYGDGLKYALRDYNAGLLDRENAPVLFYRCIETLALLVTGRDDVDDRTWAAFHQALGTSKNDLSALLRFAKSHRHGAHVAFGAKEHVAMMAETHAFILKTLRWLPGSPSDR